MFVSIILIFIFQDIIICLSFTLFLGVGIATMVMVLYYNIYYCIIVSWSLYYFIASFVSIPDVPWNTCGNYKIICNLSKFTA